MRYLYITSIFLLSFCFSCQGQTIGDDFEGNGNISTWYGDDCGINTNFTNNYQQGINTSTTVLEYHDTGGQYANIGFDVSTNFDLTVNNTFKLKVYVPSNGITGNQTNQISLKLQDGTLGAPWSTQSEIIKAIVLDEWQEVTFNFEYDGYLNIDSNSLPPIDRTDFNRVVIQVNGENNTDHVLAYIDDILQEDITPDEEETEDPVFDNLVWSDEFDGSTGAINSDNWFHQTQIPAGGSWYNGEIQHYTDRTDNSYKVNGYLHLVAKKETFNDQGYTKDYTSARLNSKFVFTYGRVEVRAKLPTGVGTWPAIWTLGQNITEAGAYWETQGYGTTGWPACGEIDIMEHWGTNQNFVQSAMHTPSSFGGTVNHGGQTIPTASTEFHVYALEWSSEKMVFSVDDVIHYTYNPEIKNASTWPFDANQYILLNIAIQPSIDPNFTQSAMEIDYVRVYQESELSVSDVNGFDKVLLFPNPAEDTLNIKIPSGLKGVQATLYSLLGQELMSFKQYELQSSIDLSQFEKGVYIIRFEDKNASSSFKIYKK